MRLRAREADGEDGSIGVNRWPPTTAGGALVKIGIGKPTLGERYHSRGEAVKGPNSKYRF